MKLCQYQPGKSVIICYLHVYMKRSACKFQDLALAPHCEKWSYYPTDYDAKPLFITIYYQKDGNDNVDIFTDF